MRVRRHPSGGRPDAFLLGCGVPLSNVVGLVDANRIGPDVAPTWSLDPSAEIVAGYLGTQPATAHAFDQHPVRAFMHRRLWLNDPDCLMLRTEAPACRAAAARTWAHTVGVSGGMALVSDDLALARTGRPRAPRRGGGARTGRRRRRPDRRRSPLSRPARPRHAPAPRLRGRCPGVDPLTGRLRAGRRRPAPAPVTGAGTTGRGPGGNALVGSSAWTPGRRSPRRTPSGGP